ncbi:MAG: hypothetical protein IKJ27_08705 [Clostridia bacterium]|nr:hypothetical protein [Clostridia bacterium]
MKKKLSKFLKDVKKDNSLRVKNSYYTFSKEYPAGNIPIKRRKNKRVQSRFLKALLLCLAFILISSCCFFLFSLGLEISDKTPTDADSHFGQTGPDLPDTDEVRALYMPYEHLGDERYIKSFLREIKRKNCNSVVITFKTDEGRLNYSSKLEYAIKGNCSAFYNDTVRNAVDLFSKESIRVIARLYCFEDPTVAEACPELAVKYMDTDINWRDGSDESGGKPWLSPTLRRNHNYIADITKELYALGIRGFILESCSYPDSENTETARFPGEKHFENRSDALKALFTKVRKALPDDAPVFMSYTATDAAEGNSALYGGYIGDAAYDGFTADLSVRDPAYTVDKKSKFSSILTLYSHIKEKNPDKQFIPVIDMSEYSLRYISAARKQGYNSYIIYSSTGEY